jgi:hypothetical protein
MKMPFLISLIITVPLFGQVPGGFGQNNGANTNSTTTSTPPTPAQLVARQLQTVALVLRLDSAQTSALTGNTGLTNTLTTEEETLQANANTLKTDYGTLATQLISQPLSVPGELNVIDGLITTDLQLRVTMASAATMAMTATSTPPAWCASVSGEGTRPARTHVTMEFPHVPLSHDAAQPSHYRSHT